MPSSAWACSSNKLKATSAAVKALIQIWVSASIHGGMMSSWRDGVGKHGGNDDEKEIGRRQRDYERNNAYNNPNNP